MKFIQRAGVGFLFAFLLTNPMDFPTARADHDGDGIPMLVSGELTIQQVDDFASRSSQVHYLLQDSVNGKTYYLHFDQLPAERLVTGMKLKVHGTGRDNHITVPANGQTVLAAPVAAALVSGTQNAVVILLNFLDANIECTQPAVNGLMFNNSASVNTVYQETSYGNVAFAGVVAGSLTINYFKTNPRVFNRLAAAGGDAATP